MGIAICGMSVERWLWRRIVRCDAAAGVANSGIAGYCRLNNWRKRACMVGAATGAAAGAALSANCPLAYHDDLYLYEDALQGPLVVIAFADAVKRRKRCNVCPGGRDSSDAARE